MDRILIEEACLTEIQKGISDYLEDNQSSHFDEIKKNKMLFTVCQILSSKPEHSNNRSIEVYHSIIIKWQ